MTKIILIMSSVQISKGFALSKLIFGGFSTFNEAKAIMHFTPVTVVGFRAHVINRILNTDFQGRPNVGPTYLEHWYDTQSEIGRKKGRMERRKEWRLHPLSSRAQQCSPSITNVTKIILMRKVLCKTRKIIKQNTHTHTHTHIHKISPGPFAMMLNIPADQQSWNDPHIFDC